MGHEIEAGCPFVPPTVLHWLVDSALASASSASLSLASASAWAFCAFTAAWAWACCLWTTCCCCTCWVRMIRCWASTALACRACSARLASSALRSSSFSAASMRALASAAGRTTTVAVSGNRRIRVTAPRVSFDSGVTGSGSGVAGSVAGGGGGGSSAAACCGNSTIRPRSRASAVVSPMPRFALSEAATNRRVPTAAPLTGSFASIFPPAFAASDDVPDAKSTPGPGATTGCARDRG